MSSVQSIDLVNHQNHESVFKNMQLLVAIPA